MARFVDMTWSAWRFVATATIVDLFVDAKDAGYVYPVFRVDALNAKNTSVYGISITIPVAKVSIGFRF